MSFILCALRFIKGKRRFELSVRWTLPVVMLFLISCAGGRTARGDGAMVVSIEPLRYIVEGIVGDDFDIEVLTPPGAGPETYEPTPGQMAAAESAQFVFSTGLIGFERAMTGRLRVPERMVDLSVGIDLIESDHDHATEGDDKGHVAEHNDKGRVSRPDDGNNGERGAEAPHHHGGADPHVWMSPRELARMARTTYERIHEAYPDSVSYTANYIRLAERLAELDATVSRRLASAATRAFMILHPGLSYYARDYGLSQISLEHDGKEPSARQLAETVAHARAVGVSRVFYQSEFPARMVQVAAAEIGAEAAEIDILGYDVVTNILKITDLILNDKPLGNE